MHVIFGAGPVGSTLARRFADDGEAVRLVSRSGSGPDHPAITRHRADATELDAVIDATRDATTITNALSPPYHRWAQDWPPMHHHLMEAARRSGALQILVDNLYAYGDTDGATLHRDLPHAATGTKGRTRAVMADELLAAHRSGELHATIARASDYVGPGVIDAALGERAMARVIAGKSVQILGSPDVPHSLAYMPDVANTLHALATDDRSWGQS